MEWIEVKPARIKKGRSDREILATESRNIDQKLGPRDYLVPLHSTGHAFSSEELAGWLDGLSGRTGGCVTFLIGGPLGISLDLLNRGQKILSLSHLTLTHEMARLVLLEQLYRAFTILRGEKYHK
jgi:23S rRNA (pseudouridine1915-N3)-methyltransferase